TPDEAVAIGEAFAREGADLIDVSAGQTWAEQQPVYGRMFQTPFSDKIRNEAKLATMAVGNIYEPDHANSILAAGRADLVALARPHLIDPFWTLRAAAQLDYRDVHVPPQYLNGMSQLARNLKREAEAARGPTSRPSNCPSNFMPGPLLTPRNGSLSVGASGAGSAVLSMMCWRPLQSHRVPLEANLIRINSRALNKDGWRRIYHGGAGR